MHNPTESKTKKNNKTAAKKQKKNPKNEILQAGTR